MQENPTGFNCYNMGIVYMLYRNMIKLWICLKIISFEQGKKIYYGYAGSYGRMPGFLGRTEGIGLLLDAVNVFPNYTDLHYTLGK